MLQDLRLRARGPLRANERTWLWKSRPPQWQRSRAPLGPSLPHSFSLSALSPGRSQGMISNSRGPLGRGQGSVATLEVCRSATNPTVWLWTSCCVLAPSPGQQALWGRLCVSVGTKATAGVGKGLAGAWSAGRVQSLLRSEQRLPRGLSLPRVFGECWAPWKRARAGGGSGLAALSPQLPHCGATGSPPCACV